MGEAEGFRGTLAPKPPLLPKAALPEALSPRATQGSRRPSGKDAVSRPSPAAFAPDRAGSRRAEAENHASVVSPHTPRVQSPAAAAAAPARLPRVGTGRWGLLT